MSNTSSRSAWLRAYEQAQLVFAALGVARWQPGALAATIDRELFGVDVVEALYRAASAADADLAEVTVHAFVEPELGVLAALPAPVRKVDPGEVLQMPAGTGADEAHRNHRDALRLAPLRHPA